MSIASQFSKGAPLEAKHDECFLRNFVKKPQLRRNVMSHVFQKFNKEIPLGAKHDESFFGAQ